MISFFVAGDPHGKERARSAVTKSGKTIHYTPEKTVAYEKNVALCARTVMVGREILVGPIKIRLLAVMPIPVSWPKWKQEAAQNGCLMPTSTPDLDNIEKSIKDGCNKIVWVDDSYVVSSSKDKIYTSSRFTSAGVYVEIEKLNALPAQIKRKP